MARAPRSDSETFTGPYGEFDMEDVVRMAQMGWGEARSQGDKGMAAVMQVAGNRMLDSRFPNRARDVILQPAQFSPFWDKQRPRMEALHIERPEQFEHAVNLAFRVLSGKEPNHVGQSTNFYAHGTVTPRWAREKGQEGAPFRIGGHTFLGGLRGGKSSTIPPQSARQSQPASDAAPDPGDVQPADAMAFAPAPRKPRAEPGGALPGMAPRGRSLPLAPDSAQSPAIPTPSGANGTGEAAQSGGLLGSLSALFGAAPPADPVQLYERLTGGARPDGAM